ncbi:hypothetical protein BDB01DRAFT_717763 [Pilobolus umbonatus]|nr:hypothetical protein BDB01DRAFT_717763 [Pilobolus umbonatus]
MTDNSVDATKKNKDELYVITPKTTILTLSQDNRLVYIIDLSSSLATVGNTRSDILLSEVFMQNMIISTNNINAVIGKLRTEFHSFQHDATQFRKLLKQTKHHMGYNLDVGNEVTPGEEEIIESAAFSNKKNKTYFPETSAIHTEDTNGTDNKDTKKPALASKGQTSSKTFKSTSYHSTKNEVWGIGKTGANLSRILHAGYFALKLLPDEGRAQLILITDGAMKSNVHDNTFVRQFAEEDITCHIIHIGYYKSFIPGRNFGFVPDIEILKFLAIATNGTFMYSEECLTDANANVFSSNDDRVDRDTSTNKYPVIQSVDLNKATHISRPNIYHIQFLFREIVLTKNHQHTESRLKGEEDSQNKINGRDSLLETNNQIKGRYNFPWDPNSKPPEGEWRLLKYREYILPSEFSHIIAARAREGFSIQSVTFDDGTSSRHGDPAIHDAALLPSAKKERLQIIMVLRWQPNITIEYRIRATWLPSVIGSHVQNEKLLMQNGIFSWGKAPRAEIFVRTDASFAHMLQNWDVFRRRAQMMDVVTGSIFFGEVYASPVYSKIEKLKSYLVDIYEGDEALRSIIGFPNKFWMNATTAPYNETGTQNLGSTHSNSNGFLSNGRLGVIPQQQAYIDAFKVLWEKINASDSRARTRCWYDPGCIDLLIGDVSPYMAPKLLSSYNMDFTSIVEEDILYMVDKLKFVVRDWADFEGKDGTFVKMMQRVISNPSISNEDATKDYFSATRAVLPSFCELRLRHEYGRLATLRLLFFNMPATSRKRTKEHLINLVKTAEETKAACNMICQRPFSRLLMRDKKHFFDDSFSPSSHSSPTLPNHDGKESGLRNFQSSSNKSKAWYLPVAMWLTSEYIVRDYLRHMTWSYSTSNFQDSYHRANKMMPIHDLAFQFLCRARLDQGYQLVSLRTNSIQFYQEITLPDISDSGTSLCAIQYFAWKDTSTGKITTELWLEPGSFNCNRYNIVKRWTFKPDIQTMSQLVTFDEIHAIGRSKKIIDFKDTSNSDQQNDRREGDLETIGLSQLFDVTSILKTNKFVVTSFRSPRYRIGADYSGYPTHPIKIRTISFIMDDNDTSDHSTSSTPTLKQKATNVSKASRYLRRHLHPNSNASSETVSPINSHSWFCIRPDSLLDKNKETIAKLNVVLQNCALLHYFVERSLDYISDGEILMTHHNVSEGFWKQLKSALQSVSHHDATSNITDLIPNLRKTRCLVKVFDPRSFVIILFPSLEYVAKGLLKLQEKDELKPTSRIEKCESLDIFMFECVRQKPMKPTKNEFVFENLMGDDKGCNIESTLEDDDDESNPIIIRKLDYLIHESDGLGLMLRPDIFEGQKKNCPAHAQLTEKVLRVAQDVVRFYSKSFFKSFYSCLLRGFIVDEDDLNKVVEVCDESNMEIEITDFLNILSIQKNMTAESEFKESDIQARFNAIFQHYFEPIKVSNGSLSNLFYYKPSFIRMEGLNNNPDTVSFEDKIANVVDLVAHSQIPLLVRLDCIYRKPNVGQNKPPFTELTVPVNSIPTSFSGTDANGDNFKFEREDVDENSAFPYNRDHTSVYLQIVFLNMVKNDLDDYTADNVMETPKE